VDSSYLLNQINLSRKIWPKGGNNDIEATVCTADPATQAFQNGAATGTVQGQGKQTSRPFRAQ
tara:strand:+ start:322 stop:510 length:189 start_codon:yes stop_codon:yes gene_type:complete